MRLPIDLDLNSLIEASNVRTPITRLSFKRGDSSRLDVIFARSGVIQELDPDPDPAATGKFGLKEEGDYVGPFIVSDLSWTKDGTGTSTVYSFEPSFNTEELLRVLVDGTISETVADQTARYALTGKAVGYIVEQTSSFSHWIVVDATKLDEAAGWEEAPQKDSVVLMGEIQWIIDGAITSTATFEAEVFSDVIRGDEGVPTQGNPEYPTPDELTAQFAALRNRTAYSVSAAGNTDLSKASAYEIQGTHRVTISAGAGAYTRTLSLTTANCANGDKAFVPLLIAGSSNPTIEVRNATSGGTLLYTVFGTGAAFNLLLSFTFNGTAWESDQ